MLKAKDLIFLSVLIVTLFGCDVEKSDIKPNAEKIIFDTDMGSDCDDVGALALLNVYADRGEAEILGCIYSSGKVPFGAGVIDAINTWYNRGNTPVGANYNNEVGDPKDKMLAQKLARDTSAFGNNIIHNFDAEEQTRLNRKLLSEQEDISVTYITVGHTKGLYDLLVSTPDDISSLTGLELVKQKVKRWVAMGALYANNDEGNYTKSWNFFFNETAPYSEYAVQNFPGEIVFIATGTDIITGKSLKDTPAGNIVRTAYRDWLWNTMQKTLDDQRPSWDIIAVYYAIEGLGDFLIEEKPGWLEIDTEKGCRWITGESDFNHKYIITKKEIAEQFEDYLNRMISTQPVSKR
jgi:inosine-uridine nucleoside N-ribohydrolase